MTYRAKPVRVEAWIIVSVGAIQSDGSMALALSNGDSVTATKEMIARFIPGEGDYVVKQDDGYLYVNPKSVFLRKYEAVGFDSVG